jgi:hypothetical protein
VGLSGIYLFLLCFLEISKTRTRNDKGIPMIWNPLFLQRFSGALDRIRTDDPRITSAVLYQLSYKGGGAYST